ncbi:phage tail terminator protein [Derxia gummosa]|uniref:Phage tail terminator protein n=1 Tax=Derxia gummosa DSM 723 TaxID=1121388 RepID=A0A8B6X2Z8_9BURK|nr:hypothetical protein [Derxia gummosa]
MRLSLIIDELRARAPSFAGRVAGAASYQAVADNDRMAVPCAYVVPLDDDGGANRSATGTWQQITDGFGVVVVVSNALDERGQESTMDAVHELRAELWAALIGWAPPADSGDDYDGITYRGGGLLRMTRARLHYQYEFEAVTELHGVVAPDAATRQARDLAALPPLDGIDLVLDAIRSTSPPAPSGGADATLRIDLSTS